MDEDVPIHYATVSSLREVLGPGGDSWFKEWRRGATRRLSQCPEEEENLDDPNGGGGGGSSGVGGPGTKAGSTSGLNTSSSSSSSSSAAAALYRRRHLDKRFFDGSLVEMKSQASSMSTLVDRKGTPEEIWVKRTDSDLSRHKKDTASLSGSLGDSSESSSMGSQDRNDMTWGSQTRQILARVEAERRRAAGGSSGHHHKEGGVYHTVTGASSSSAHRHTPHTPSIFEVFRPRSKSDAATKKPGTIIGHMKSAMQNSLKSDKGGGGGGEGGESGRGPVAKVIHLFRHRSQSAASAEEKRKARAAALYQQQAQLQSVIRRSSLEKRRLSLGGTIAGHRGSDPSLDPNHAAILFRDSRGLPVADPFLEKVNLSEIEDENQIFVKFFKFHKCYDLIPTSAKLVVFDTQLLVKKAFFALVNNGVRAAPLWDSKRHKFVGMLTITDFIRILQRFYSSGSSVIQEQMEEHKLDTWRSVLKDDEKELIRIGPDESLYEAIRVLIHNRIHRLPVIDPETNNVLYILTHKRILRFLFLYINDLPRPSFMNASLSELRIGTFDDIESAQEETSIIEALNKFVERRVSALPIVDSQKRLIDIFAKFDVINLAAEKTYDNLDMTLKKANEHRNEWFEGVQKCSMDDTLFAILERIVRAEVHRLVVTDDDDKVIGVLSLSDLLQFLVLRPCGEDVISRPMTPISEIEGASAPLLLQSQSSEETILEGEEDEEEDCEEIEERSNLDEARSPRRPSIPSALIDVQTAPLAVSE